MITTVAVRLEGASPWFANCDEDSFAVLMDWLLERWLPEHPGPVRVDVYPKP